MKTLEINITTALQTTKEILTAMMSQGLADAKFTFALSNMISEKYDLTQEQSILIIENALKLV